MEIPLRPESELQFPHPFKEILGLIQIAAKQAGVTRLALVGGAVRDCLINYNKITKIQKIHDFDFVVEGSPIKLSDLLLEKFTSKRVSNFRIHQKYQTIELSIDRIKINIATARKEQYNKSGFNPEVSPTTIEEDLYRRDFTINAIAFEPKTQQLIDPYNGINAIRSKQLILIHSRSIEEDPTRIIRAARYAARLNFQLSSESISQIKSTLSLWPWGSVHNEPFPHALSTRMRMELNLLFNKEPWESCLELLQEWGALSILEGGLQVDKRWKRRIHWGIRLRVPRLLCFIAGADNPNLLAKQLQLPTSEQKVMEEFFDLKSYLSNLKIKEEHSSPIFWCKILESRKWSKESICIAICFGVNSWEKLLKWYLKWRHIKSPKSAAELISSGWEAGPSLGAEISRLRYQEIETLEDSKYHR